MKLTTKCWLALGVLALLSPLGIILPAQFRAGGAWGEWGADQIGTLVGYVPKGLTKLGGLWPAPLPDYALKGGAQKGLAHLSVTCVVSAVAGMGLVAGVMWLVGRLLAKNDDATEKT